MDSPLAQARLAFERGIEYFEAGHFESAAQQFAVALALSPGRPSLLLNMGVTQIHLREFNQAEFWLSQAVVADDSLEDAWSGLGLSQMEQGKWRQALDSHERAVACGMESAAGYLRLGQCLAHEGRVDDALRILQVAVDLDNGLAEGWSQLGHLWRDLQQVPQAIECYERALDAGADLQTHRYYLAALQPSAVVPDPPSGYVEALFDQYADDFEGHLVGQLRYQAPEFLREHLPLDCPAVFRRLLDLGCGTGLCGAAMRSRAAEMWGVDLSAPMLAKAGQRRAYTRLVQADIAEFLRHDAGSFDLVMAADVFIYVGHLEEVFELLAQRIDAQGWLAFTFEESKTGASVELTPSLRYSHSMTYIEFLAARYGFDLRASHAAPLRFDQATPVHGHYVYLQRGQAVNVQSTTQ